MKKLIALMILLPILAFSQVTIKSIVGKADYSLNGKVKALKVNTTLSTNSIIITQSGSSIVLQSKDGKVMRIDGKRTVSVKEIMDARIKTKNSLLNKLKKKNDSETSGVTAVAGVRGADVSVQKREDLKKELYWEE